MPDAIMRRMDDGAPLDPTVRRLDLIGGYIRQGHVYMQEAPGAAERHTQAIEDHRLTLNQMNLRSERITRQMLAELAFGRARRRWPRAFASGATRASTTSERSAPRCSRSSTSSRPAGGGAATG
jgi:hypothetical protein